MVTEKDYDLSCTWFDGEQDPSDDLAPTNATNLDDDHLINEAQSCSTSLKGANEVSLSNEGGSTPNSDSISVSMGDDELRMPTMVNLQESGLRQSPQIVAVKALPTIMAVFFTPVTAIPAFLRLSLFRDLPS